MIYYGRLIFNTPLELTKNVWWSSELRKTQRTSEVSQLNPGKMLQIENMDPDSVPDTMDDRLRVKGAAKYAQLGVEACQQVLTSSLQGASYETVGPAVLVIDLNVGCGEMYQAFLNQRPNQPHTFFLGFCEDQNQATYVEQVSRELLVEKYMGGAPMPNGEKLDFNVPQDLLESLPDIPRLNVLVPYLCF